MTRELEFPIAPADPAMVILICGHYANLPRWKVEHVWQYQGEHYCSVVPANRSAFDPPDATIYRVTEGETSVGGDGYGDRCCAREDAPCLQFVDVGFYDGTKGRVVWDEDELSEMEKAL